MAVKVAIVGAGAIGSIFAAVLTEKGADVRLCARTDSGHGRLRVDQQGRVHDVGVTVLTDPGQVTEPADWVLVATKAHDVPSAAGWLEALTGPRTTVAVLQNGIDHEARLRPWVRPGTPILPALLYLASEVRGPGQIDWSFGTRVTVPAGPEATRFAELLAGTGLDVDARADFTQAAWRKLLVNMVANPITTLTDQRLGVLQNADIRLLTQSLLAEALITARAAGVDLPWSAIQDTIDFADGLPPTDGSSMYYDRRSGRPTEHELIVGAVVRTAARHGVQVPVTAAILALLRGMNDKPAQSCSRRSAQTTLPS
ncbi:2-dehydropantoate 2-reductase [Actinoplanes sp. CA-054009]